MTKSAKNDVISSVSNCNVNRRSSLMREMVSCGATPPVLRWPLGATGGDDMSGVDDEAEEDGTGGSNNRELLPLLSPPHGSAISHRRNVVSRKTFGLENRSPPVEAGYSK